MSICFDHAAVVPFLETLGYCQRHLKAGQLNLNLETLPWLNKEKYVNI